MRTTKPICRAVEGKRVCLVNGNYSINMGAPSPSLTPQKAPSLGLPCPFPWCCVPTLPPGPHPILPAVEGREVREVLTQAHILPGRAAERQGQDHCQQPGQSGLHGDGRAVGAGHSVDVPPLPRSLIYTPMFAQVFRSLFVWGQPFNNSNLTLLLLFVD